MEKKAPEAKKEAEVVRLPYHYSVLGPNVQVELPKDADGKPQPSIHLRAGSTVELSPEELVVIEKEHGEVVQHLRCLAPVVTEEANPQNSETKKDLEPPPLPQTEAAEERAPVTADEGGRPNRGVKR